MGQGLGVGAALGISTSIVTMPLNLSLMQHLTTIGGCALMGTSVDFVSDCFAKQGKVIVHRDVVINASDVLRHVATFYTPCVSNRWSKLIGQKHEWLVLESHSSKFYVVQKDPATGNVTIDMRTSSRNANDCGLRTAGQPTLAGEIRQRRADQEFDLPNDLQVAYVIAWLRKEDPRWALSTENSRHFTTRLRTALNDF